MAEEFTEMPQAKAESRKPPAGMPTNLPGSCPVGALELAQISRPRERTLYSLTLKTNML